MTHLYDGSFCLPQLNTDPQWNTNHGRKSHHPPYAIAPIWVCIYIVIFQRLILHQEKDEDSLKESGLHLFMLKTAQVILPWNTKMLE